MRIKQAIFICFSIFIVSHVFGQEQLKLRQILQKAETANPDFELERINVAMAEADLTTAKLRPNFTFNTENIQMLHSKRHNPSINWNNKLNRETAWHLGKPLQIAGQRKHKVNLAKEALRLDVLHFENEFKNLSGEVANHWLKTWVDKNKLILLDETISKLELIQKTDSEELNLQLRKYKLQRLIAQEKTNNNYSVLKELTGIEQAFEIDTDESDLIIGSESLSEWVEDAIQKEQGSETNKIYQNMADANLKLQKSLAVPQPELGALYNTLAGMPYLGFYLSFDIPVFDRNQGEIQKAKLMLQQNEVLQTAELEQKRADLLRSINSYKNWKQIVEEAQKLYEIQSESLEKASDKLSNQTIDFEDYLKTLSDWEEIRSNYLEYGEKHLKNQIKLLTLSDRLNP